MVQHQSKSTCRKLDVIIFFLKDVRYVKMLKCNIYWNTTWTIQLFNLAFLKSNVMANDGNYGSNRVLRKVEEKVIRHSPSPKTCDYANAWFRIHNLRSTTCILLRSAPFKPLSIILIFISSPPTSIPNTSEYTCLYFGKHLCVSTPV